MHVCAHTLTRTHAEALGGTVTLATCNLTWTQAGRLGLQALLPQQVTMHPGRAECGMRSSGQRDAAHDMGLGLPWVGPSLQKLLRKISREHFACPESTWGS